MAKYLSMLLFNPLLECFLDDYQNFLPRDAKTGQIRKDFDHFRYNLYQRVKEVKADGLHPKPEVFLEGFRKSLQSYGPQLENGDLSWYWDPSPVQCDFLGQLQLRTLLRDPSLSLETKKEIVDDIPDRITGLWLVAKALDVVPARILQKLKETADSICLEALQQQKRGGPPPELDLVRVQQAARQLILGSNLSPRELVSVLQYGHEFLTHKRTPIYELVPSSMEHVVKWLIETASQKDGIAYFQRFFSPAINSIKQHVGEETWQKANEPMQKTHEDMTEEERQAQLKTINHLFDVVSDEISKHRGSIQDAFQNPDGAVQRAFSSELGQQILMQSGMPEHKTAPPPLPRSFIRESH